MTKEEFAAIALALNPKELINADKVRELLLEALSKGKELDWLPPPPPPPPYEH